MILFIRPGPMPKSRGFHGKKPSRIDSTYMRDAQMNLYGQSDPALFRFFAKALLGEIPSLCGIFHISGGDILQLASYHQVADILDLPDEYAVQKERVLSLLNMRRVIQGPPLEELLAGRIPDKNYRSRKSAGAPARPGHGRLAGGADGERDSAHPGPAGF